MARLATALGAALVASLALVAASCGGSRSDGSIRLLAFGDPPELNAYRTVIRAFEEEEPDIDVQLVEASDREDLIARLSTSLAGGSPPDLFLMNYRFYGQFAARDVLEPLEPYVEDSDAFALDDFFPQAVDAFRWDGQVDVPASEHLEPRRLLQPRSLRAVRRARAHGRHVLEPVRLPRAAADAGRERARSSWAPTRTSRRPIRRPRRSTASESSRP